MESRSSTPKVLASGLFAVILVSSAGCTGFLGSSGTSAGELRIDNEDNQTHEVVIGGARNGEITQTVVADSSQTITLVDSPSNYTIHATIDGTTRANATVEYSQGGENGDQLAGPGLILTIRPNGEASFSQSVE